MNPNTIRVIVFDGETTVQRRDGEKDGSPFNGANRLVSGHWFCIEIDPSDLGQLRKALNDVESSRNFLVQSAIFYHVEINDLGPDSKDDLQDALHWADMFVAHNAKFDIQWLIEAGFDVPPRVHCTQIGEFIFARGQKIPLSLKETAIRRGTHLKKGELVDDYFNKQKLCFSEMPLDVVIEYAESDVISCGEIFLNQLIDLHAEENRSLRNIFELMNEMLLFVNEIETNGIKIDREALDDVEKLFRAEQVELKDRLMEIAEEVMGDQPVNLASNADLSAILYSRRVTDKALHKEVFNLGTDHRGKPKYPPRMSKTEFATAVRTTTHVIDRTTVHCCPSCKGAGTFQQWKKNGEPYKNRTKCKECKGSGVLYLPNGKKAGMRLVPMGPHWAAVDGFKTDKDTIQLLIAQATDKGRPLAVEFLTKLRRLNAVSSYLSSFVDGIKFWLRTGDILHPNFNQTVAATGRLSSSKPNFQNQPKGGKFPVRKAVVSRFDGGLILEADFSGLEFRVAGELSRDAQIIADVLNGKDIHKQTASIIHQRGPETISKDERQGAKAYSFAPLYGGMGASEAEHIQQYFKEFFVIYKGMRKQQEVWCESALKTGIVETPSGRQYEFKGVKRFRGGRVSQQTNIVNFPVQGFATGDVVPLACIRALREFRRLGLKSLLIITVHDSIVVDVYPGELETVQKSLAWAMTGVVDEIKERWGYEFVLPLAIEMEAGENWMTMSELEIPEWKEAA